MALTWVVAIFCFLVFCIGFDWGDRRAAKELAQRKLPAGEAPDRTPVVQQSLGAPDFGGIAKLSKKLTPSGQLLIGGCLRGNRGWTRRRRFSHGTLTRPRESFACGPYAVGHRARRPIQASTMFNGFASSRYPNRGQDAATFVTGPGIDAPDDPPTIDAMPLEIHTQPDPDHLCETCGGPSELVSQTITPWDGNETVAREVSPWTPRCADPWCKSRRPRHSKMSDTRVCGH